MIHDEAAVLAAHKAATKAFIDAYMQQSGNEPGSQSLGLHRWLQLLRGGADSWGMEVPDDTVGDSARGS